MQDKDKTKEQLLREVQALRQQVTEVQMLEVDQKQAQEALQESEQRYRTLVEQSLQAIVVMCDVPPRILFANSTCADITGLSVEELLSLGPEDTQALIHPDDRPLLFQRLADHLAGKQVPSSGAFRLVRRGGQIRWVEYYASLVDYDGQPAVQSAFVDITAHKETVEALRQERDLMDRITSTSPIGIAVLDRHGKVTYVNHLLEAELGLPKDEITQLTYNAPELGMTDYEGTSLPDEELPFWRVMQSGEPVLDVRHAVEWPAGHAGSCR
jgi:PAS domain S-box-containing protein